MTTAVATTKPKPARPSVRRGGRYSAIKGGVRDDIPGKKFRSSWDANLYRLMKWLSDGNGPRELYFKKLLGPNAHVVQVEYEMEQGYPATYYFPGSKTTGNAKYTPDIPFQIVVVDRNHNTGHINVVSFQYYLEGKGSLKEGGWLNDVDLSQLNGVDDDSRIKLERWRKYYPGRAFATFVVGQREYKALTATYKSVIPHWE